MECDALDKAVERVCASLCKVGAKSIASDILHLVLVG